MRKQWILAVLCAALLLSGCRKTESAPAPVDTPVPTAAPTATPETTPTPEPTPAPPDRSDLPGSTDKLVYTNRWFGIGCTLEPNWNVYSEAQIAELTGMAREKMAEDLAAAYEEALSGGDPVYCMAAASNKRNLNMTIQTAGDMDAASALSASAQELTGALESLGMTEVRISEEPISFAGQAAVPGLSISGRLGDKPLCLRCAAVEAWGYIAVVTAAAPSAEEADAILSAWYALETE